MFCTRILNQKFDRIFSTSDKSRKKINYIKYVKSIFILHKNNNDEKLLTNR